MLLKLIFDYSARTEAKLFFVEAVKLKLENGKQILDVCCHLI